MGHTAEQLDLEFDYPPDHRNRNLSQLVVLLSQTGLPFHPLAVPNFGKDDFGMSNLPLE